MRQKDDFEIITIRNTPYLLPCGQRIAENRRGIRLNETGVFLWNELAKVHSREELLKKLTKKYGSVADSATLEEDMEQFLTQLSAWGFIEDDHSDLKKTDIFSIGGITVQLKENSSLFPVHDYLGAFRTDSVARADLSIHCYPVTGIDSIPTGGTMLICTGELILCELAEQYLLLLPKARQLHYMTISKDGHLAELYYIPSHPDTLDETMFHAIRFLYLYCAQRHNRFVLHSASILYRDRVWLFSGSSGTGKSTHTALWHRLFQTPIINGDLNLLTLEKNTAYIHGIPWCGTSGCFDTKSYRLGGIIHLQQAPTISCTEPVEEEKVLLTSQRLISPSWTGDLLNKNIAFCEKLCDTIPIFKLSCTMENESAITMKQIIDKHLLLEKENR